MIHSLAYSALKSGDLSGSMQLLILDDPSREDSSKRFCERHLRAFVLEPGIAAPFCASACLCRLSATLGNLHSPEGERVSPLRTLRQSAKSARLKPRNGGLRRQSRSPGTV